MCDRGAPGGYTIRDDAHYTVIVGWEKQLQTFYAYVFAADARDGIPVFAASEHAHEISAISRLADLVSGFASLDAQTTTALRHDSTPLAKQGD